MTEHKRVDLDAIQTALDHGSVEWDGIRITTSTLQSMIHELRLLRQLDRSYGGWCMGCGHNNPGHTDDCPVKALGEMEK